MPSYSASSPPCAFDTLSRSTSTRTPIGVSPKVPLVIQLEIAADVAAGSIATSASRRSLGFPLRCTGISFGSSLGASAAGSLSLRFAIGVSRLRFGSPHRHLKIRVVVARPHQVVQVHCLHEIGRAHV